MTRAEVEKLLGGHATGTLTEAERQALYRAALEDQALFEALMDEEALRELLADPGAKAALLKALEPAASVKIVPFWRRPGVLGAAAGVLMASLAGLTWLRNPQAPPPPRPEPAGPKAEVTGAPAAPAPLHRNAEPPRPAVVAPAAPQPTGGSVAAPAMQERSRDEAAAGMQAKAAEKAVPPVAGPPSAPAGGAVPVAQDRLEKKAEAPRPAAVVEVLAATPAPPPVQAPAPPVRAKALGRVAGVSSAVEVAAPVWDLAPQADGTTRVAVTVPRGAVPVLLKRGAGAVEPQAGRLVDPGDGAPVRWLYRVRLKAGEALDLYLLAHPAGDPASLPETGPVDGFRARIFPAAR